MSSGSSNSDTPGNSSSGSQKPTSTQKPNVSSYAYHSPTDPRFNPEPDEIAVRLGLSPLRDLRTIQGQSNDR